MITFIDRVKALKRLEQECYSLCLYLLENEKAAIDAAKQTLVELFDDKRFWSADDSEQRARLRRKATFHCLQQQVTGRKRPSRVSV